jgi:hypothetical protein
MKGHRWVAWDVDFFIKPFGHSLLEKFGPTGVVVFIGLVSACKVGRPPGQIRYAGDDALLRILGLDDLELVDSGGRLWTLDSFWRFTARHKVTTRTRSGRLTHIELSHWADWQYESDTVAGTERKRRSRARQSEASRDKGVTSKGDETDPSPTATPTNFFSQNGTRTEEELVDLKAAVAVLKEQMGWGDHAQG